MSDFDSVRSDRLTVDGAAGCDGLYHLANGPRDGALTAGVLRIETTQGTVRVVAANGQLVIETEDDP